MKFSIDDIKLSGKGAIVTDEVLHENIKITANESEFHELVLLEDDTSKRIGWLVPNSFELAADFTVHSPDGMRGKSTQDTVERSVIMDNANLLADILPEKLVEVDTEESEVILEAMKKDKFHGKDQINLDGEIDDDSLLVLSPYSKFVFVQTHDSSVRIHGGDGVYVLKRGDPDKLVLIDSDHGVNIHGDKEISIGPGGLIINGEPFDIGNIVGNAMGSLASSLGNLDIHLKGLEDLGSHLGNLGEKIGKTFTMNFEKNFEKNFGKKFGKKFGKTFSFDFDPDFADDFDDFDTDFDDEEGHDVDVEF